MTILQILRFFFLFSFFFHSVYSQNIIKQSISIFEEFVNDKGEKIQKTTNKSYHLFNLKLRDKWEDVLLQKTIHRIKTQGVESIKPSLSLTAFGYDEGEYNKLLWEIKDTGYYAEIVNNFIEIKNFKHSGLESTHHFFNLLTGKKLIGTTTSLFEIYDPKNNLKRFVGYLCFNSEDGLKLMKLPNSMGALYYCSEDTIIDRINLSADLGGLPWSPKISLIGEKEKLEREKLNIFDLNTENSFYIKLKFQENMEIQIPANINGFYLDGTIILSEVDIKLTRY